MTYIAAIALNNLAIVHLSSGNCLRGHEVLNRALQCLNDDMTVVGLPKKHELSEGNPNPHCIPISYDWVDFSDSLKQQEEAKKDQPPPAKKSRSSPSSSNKKTNDIRRPFLCHLVVKINIDPHDGVFPDRSSPDIDSQVRWVLNYKYVLRLKHAVLRSFACTRRFLLL